MDKSLRQNWRAILLISASLSFGSSISRTFLKPGRPPVNADSAFFQHAGWYITQGAVPYVDIWDIKPPLMVELTTLLATISSGNMHLLHLLSVLITAIAGIGGVYLVGLIVYEITANEYASVVSGLTMLTLAGYHWLPSTGARPKYFAIFFGSLALLLQLREKPLYSGGAAALAAGFMQHAIVFPILILGMIIINQGSGKRKLKRSISGIIIVGVITVTPIVLMGAFDEMIVEVILVSLLTSEGTQSLSILARLGKGLLDLGYASLPVIFGVYGILKAGKSNFKQYWWVVIGAAIYAFQILFVDFDNYPDLFFGLLFVSIGLGLLMNMVNTQKEKSIAVVVSLTVVISVVGLGGFGIVSSSLVDENEQSLMHSTVNYIEYTIHPNGVGEKNPSIATNISSKHGEMSQIYWDKIKPDSCHYRLSGAEIRWINKTNSSFSEDKCGDIPQLRVLG